MPAIATKPTANYSAVQNPEYYPRLSNAGLSAIKDRIIATKEIARAYDSIIADLDRSRNDEKFWANVTFAAQVTLGIADGLVGGLGEMFDSMGGVKAGYDLFKPLGAAVGASKAGGGADPQWGKALMSSGNAALKIGLKAKGLDGAAGTAAEMGVDAFNHIGNAVVDAVNKDHDSVVAELKAMTFNMAVGTAKLAGPVGEGAAKLTAAAKAVFEASQSVGKAVDELFKAKDDIDNQTDRLKQGFVEKIRVVRARVAMMEAEYAEYRAALFVQTYNDNRGLSAPVRMMPANVPPMVRKLAGMP